MTMAEIPDFFPGSLFSIIFPLTFKSRPFAFIRQSSQIYANLFKILRGLAQISGLFF
jgi:hypothetical protein